MRLTREQAEQLTRAFEKNGAQELEVERDGMGRLRVYQIEILEKRHPVKLGTVAALHKP